MQQKSTFKETIVSSLPREVQPYVGELFSANGMIILFCCLFLIINRNKNPKGQLASGRWANQQEIAAARKTACEQMSNPKDEKFALYIGTPRGHKFITEPDGRKILCLPEDPRTIYFPNAQENILYIGRSGSGKTFSGGNPFCLRATAVGAEDIARIRTWRGVFSRSLPARQRPGADHCHPDRAADGARRPAYRRHGRADPGCHLA